MLKNTKILLFLFLNGIAFASIPQNQQCLFFPPEKNSIKSTICAYFIEESLAKYAENKKNDNFKQKKLSRKYTQLGDFYSEASLPIKAIVLYSKALEIEFEFEPINELSVSNLFDKIGTSYCDADRYEESLFFYRKSLSLKELSGEDKALISESHGNIAMVLNNLENYEESISEYIIAIEMQKKIYPTDHPYLAETYCSLAMVFHNSGRFEDSLSLLLEAARIQIKQLGDTHVQTRNTLEGIAVIQSLLSETSIENKPIPTKIVLDIISK